MKHCNTCGETDEDKFYPYLKSRCKRCESQKTHARRKRTMKLIQRWKRRKSCQHCGYNKDPRALQLDHIDPDAKGTTHGEGVNYGWGRKRIKGELAKCQVLCANCHSIKTSEEGQGGRKKIYDYIH